MPKKVYIDPAIAISADTDWGPETWGAALIVDPTRETFDGMTATLRKQKKPLVVDVEDDENGVFVGCGVAYDDKTVFYFSEINVLLRDIISREYLIGHNIKSDMHKLKKWGLDVHSNQIFSDTMIKSYVQNSTRDSQGLKELCKEILDLSWPQYREIVGKGVRKKTLDKQDVMLVARYNGCDVLATYRLDQYFNKVLTEDQKNYYENLELPLTRLLYDMEERGVSTDVEYLRKLDSYFDLESQRLRRLIQRAVRIPCEEEINLNSPIQVQKILFAPHDINVTSTNKEALRPYANVPLVQLFHRYREVTKLRNTYTSTLLALPSAPVVHTTYNQCSYQRQDDKWGGIRTGRLSSSGPNLQNIPTRTATGDTLRRSFVPRQGYVFLDFDYSQIEWRLAAHFSKDERMIETLRQDKDIYQELADDIGCERSVAKTMALAMNYNAGGYKVASILQVPNNVAFDYVDKYRKAFPQFFDWKDQQMEMCKINGYITTLFNRTIRPGLEYLAVPFLIQGSAGEIIKNAMLRCQDHDWIPAITVHDELLFELLPENIEEDKETIKFIMENIVELAVALKVDVGQGMSWQGAKN